MNIHIILPFLILGAGIVLVIFFVFRKDPTLEKTVAALGGKHDVGSGRFILNKNGVDYWYRYTPPGRNSPAVLTVAVPCSSHGEFTVVPENRFDREAKKIGLATEIQTTDEDFNNAYYIISDTVDFAREYFKSEAKRLCVRQLYSAGFTKIRHDGKTMLAEWVYFDKNRLSPDLIKAAADHLFEMIASLPDYFASEEVFGIPRLRLKVIAAYTIPSLGVLAGLTAYFWVLQYPPLDGAAVFLKSLIFSLPAFIVYMALAVAAVSGRAAAHKDLLAIAGISIVACLLLSNNFLVIINGKLDPHKATAHDTVVIDKYLVRSKDSTTYYVHLSSWCPGRAQEKFTVSEYAYQRIIRGQTRAVVTTKPGRLGFEWVIWVDYRFK